MNDKRPKRHLRRIFGAGLVMAFTGAIGSAPPIEVRDFLEFESVLDGRCQILSAGGKLRVMRNVHPTIPIKFRLIRSFADVRQRGRATGIAEPGGEVVKLGCTLVGGRPQRWDIERAQFVEDQDT